ncbi:MAG: hypothetical protein KAG97_12005, partial [Victivallales bacterium]|nr:hypothetical protein [Victivallales bacterium]
DPEVAVVTLKDKKGDTLGALVNFACHPTHHGGMNEISAGFPGVLASKMKDVSCPVTLYLNGFYGNIATTDHRLDVTVSMEDAGERLFEAVTRSVADVAYFDSAEIAAVKENVSLPFREVTDEEYHGKVRGAQRFRSDELYEKDIDVVIEKKKKYGMQLAEVQVLRLGEFYFAGMPAEAFVEFQLRIKTETFPKRAVVVGGANGMVGYVPTKDAFARGGYETTLGPPSRMAPETGDILTDKAIELILGI